MSWYKNLRMLYKIAIPMSIALVLVFGAMIWATSYMVFANIRSLAEKELAAMGGQYGNEAKAFFEAPLNQSQAIAEGLAVLRKKNTPPSREMQIDMLAGMLKSNPVFIGAGIAWEPNALDGKDAEFKNTPGSDLDGRFIPYLLPNGKLEPLKDLEPSDYYKIPKQRNNTSLSMPYVYESDGQKTLMTTASAAIKIDGKFQGIALVDISLEKVSEIIKNLKIYNSGWAFIMTQQGDIFAHSQPEMVGKNFFSLRTDEGSVKRKSALEAGKPYLDMITIDGESNFYCYFPINFLYTGQTWYLVVCAPENEVLSEAANTRSTMVLISIVALILILAIVFPIIKASVKPLRLLADASQKIAAGDMVLRLNRDDFSGETKELYDSLKEMIETLIGHIDQAEKLGAAAKEESAKAEEAMREAEASRGMAESKHKDLLHVAGRLQDVAKVVGSASEELSIQIGQVERGSTEQASRISETATAMDEMNSTVIEVARNAGTASEVSSHTKNKAEEGSAVVLEAVSGIQNVQKVSLELKDDMGTLDEQARSITNIMSVISDIADQTNLLALNAAIEAARAGEAGRGFAVVADEVRKLAEKTMISTKDVGEAIGSIQGSVRHSIEQVERAVELIDAVTIQANKSGEALNEIVSMVDEAADQVRAIATASEQQSSASEEISNSINQVNIIASQTAEGMQHAAKAVAELVDQARNLNELIKEMTL